MKDKRLRNILQRLVGWVWNEEKAMMEHTFPISQDQAVREIKELFK